MGNQKDIVILDIKGVRGLDLLELAVSRNFPVAMLTAQALTPESLKCSFEMGARALPPQGEFERNCSLPGGCAQI